MKTINKVLVAVALSLTAASPAFAGGLFGDIVEFGCGGCGAGRALDGAHDQIKQANPSYGRWEEDLTNRTRKNIGLEPHCTPVFDKYGQQRGCI